jgi:hypothetical protein
VRLIGQLLRSSPVTRLEAVDYSLADQVGLLSSPRRVRRDVDPDLQDISDRQASAVDRPSKRRLWCCSLPDDDVGRLGRQASSETPPRRQVLLPDAMYVDVGRYSLNQPESERICGSE